MGGMEDAGRRVGMYMTLGALGAVAGPPIAGALISPTRRFVGTGCFAGRFIEYAVF